jgi:hypothetical protein
MYPSGAFCWECQNAKLTAPGILWFKPDDPRGDLICDNWEIV